MSLCTSTSCLVKGILRHIEREKTIRLDLFQHAQSLYLSTLPNPTGIPTTMVTEMKEFTSPRNTRIPLPLTRITHPNVTDSPLPLLDKPLADPSGNRTLVLSAHSHSDSLATQPIVPRERVQPIYPTDQLANVFKGRFLSYDVKIYRVISLK